MPSQPEASDRVERFMDRVDLIKVHVPALIGEVTRSLFSDMRIDVPYDP
jgi:hypothetical protein